MGKCKKLLYHQDRCINMIKHFKPKPEEDDKEEVTKDEKKLKIKIDNFFNLKREKRKIKEQHLLAREVASYSLFENVY